MTASELKQRMFDIVFEGAPPEVKNRLTEIIGTSLDSTFEEILRLSSDDDEACEALLKMTEETKAAIEFAQLNRKSVH